jgi:iron complex transport system substrate-binding protein
VAVGALVGSGGRGRAAAARLRGAVARVRRLVHGRPRARVFVDRGARFTIDPNGIGAALIRLAGGVDVATKASVDAEFGLSRLRKAAPTVYLAVPGATSLAKLRRAKATRSLPAVRAGRFHVIDRGSLTDTGPRVARTLDELAALLHPGATAQ